MIQRFWTRLAFHVEHSFVKPVGEKNVFKGPLYGLKYSKSFLRNNTAILYLLPNSNSSEVLSGGRSEVAVTVYEEPAGLHPW